MRIGGDLLSIWDRSPPCLSTVARLSGVSLRSVKRIAEERTVEHEHGRGFPETGGWDSAGNPGPGIVRDSASSEGKRLLRRQDRALRDWAG